MKGFTNNKTLIAFGLALFVVLALWLAVPLTAWTYADSWTLDSTGATVTEFTTSDDVVVVVNITKNTADVLRGTSIEVDRPSGANIDVIASYCELYDSSDNLLDNVTYDSTGGYDSLDYGYGYGYGFNYYGYGYGYWYGAAYSGSNTYLLCYYEFAGSDHSYAGTYTYDVYLGLDTTSRTKLQDDAGTWTSTSGSTGGVTGGGGVPVGQSGNTPTDTFEIPIECTNSQLNGDVYISYTGSLIAEETTVKIETSTTNTVSGGFEFTTTIDDISCEDITSISPTATSMEEGSCIITWELDGDETIELKIKDARLHKTDLDYEASACEEGQQGGEEEIPETPTTGTEEKPEATIECTQTGTTMDCVVTDENGNILANEEVTVIGPDGTVYTYTTDENGKFSFLASQAGRWSYTSKDYDASGSLVVGDSAAPGEEIPEEEGSDMTIPLIIAGIIIIAIIYWWTTTNAGKKGLFKVK